MKIVNRIVPAQEQKVIVEKVYEFNELSENAIDEILYDEIEWDYISDNIENSVRWIIEDDFHCSEVYRNIDFTLDITANSGRGLDIYGDILLKDILCKIDYPKDKLKEAINVIDSIFDYDSLTIHHEHNNRYSFCSWNKEDALDEVISYCLYYNDIHEDAPDKYSKDQIELLEDLSRKIDDFMKEYCSNLFDSADNLQYNREYLSQIFDGDLFYEDGTRYCEGVNDIMID